MEITNLCAALRMFQMIFSQVLTHINIFVLLQLPAPAGWSCCRQSLCLEILCSLSWWWGVAQVHDPPLESSRQNVSTSITVWRYVDRQLLSVTLYRSCSQQSVDSSDYHSVIQWQDLSWSGRGEYPAPGLCPEHFSVEFQ